MGEYGQFCPVAKAAEVLDQRWTLLVLRELVAGSTRFNDIHRGVPRMSRSLLSRRLAALVREGIISRDDGPGGPSYRLTDSGRELEQVIEAVGKWGVRWPSELRDEDLDPGQLVWDIHRRVDIAAVPAGRTVLRITFTDRSREDRSWWLLLHRAGVDVCDHDPGLDTDVAITTSVRTLARVWRGDRRWDDAVGAGELTIQGPEPLRRQVQRWFLLSPFAAVPRPVPANPERAPAHG